MAWKPVLLKSNRLNHYILQEIVLLGKLFLTKSYDAADECILCFICSVTEAIYSRKIKFQINYVCLTILFMLFAKST